MYNAIINTDLPRPPNLTYSSNISCHLEHNSVIKNISSSEVDMKTANESHILENKLYQSPENEKYIGP